MPPRLAGLRVDDTPAAWAALGFDVQDGVVSVRNLLIACDPGATGWWFEGALDGIDPSAAPNLDGIAVLRPPHPPPTGPSPHADAHPNGITDVDHVVVMSPDGERTVDAFAAAGLELRRRRDTSMGGAPWVQWFFRPGSTIVELAAPLEPTGDGPATLWGVTFVSDDLDGSVSSMGPHISEIRPAVQPGRRIASVRRSAGISTQIAVMDPHVRRGSV